MREVFLVVWPYMLVAMTFTLIGYLCGWRDCLRARSHCGYQPQGDGKVAGAPPSGGSSIKYRDRAVCSERSRGPLGLD
jgi:hypothetical protein